MTNIAKWAGFMSAQLTVAITATNRASVTAVIFGRAKKPRPRASLDRFRQAEDAPGTIASTKFKRRSSSPASRQNHANRHRLFERTRRSICLVPLRKVYLKGFRYV